jgi:hypothetical protein
VHLACGAAYASDREEDVNAESETNRRLGYPDDARLLLVNADDLGMRQAINEAAILAFQEGIVQSTSLMVPCPGAAQAIQWLRENPDISFGVHLTIVRDYEHDDWGAVAARDGVTSLLDENGRFYSDRARWPEMLAKARPEELELEFRAQVEADIFDLMFALAREYGLALRVASPPTIRKVQAMGLPTADYGLLDSYHLPTENKTARYIQMLRELPAGLSEWAVHPSLGDAESQVLDPEGWQVRRADFEFLVSTQAREAIRREGIILIGYGAIQRVWQSA